MAQASEEVVRLIEVFALAIHEAARQELLEEMRAFAAARQKREPRRAPKKKAKRSPKVRRRARRHTSSFRPSKEAAKPERFTTRDIRAAVEVAKKNDATVHGKGCRRHTTGNCGKNCYVPVPIDPGSPLADLERITEEIGEDDSLPEVPTGDEGDEGAGAQHPVEAETSDRSSLGGEPAPAPGEPAERKLAAKPRRYPPEEIAAKGYRVVVVRVDGKAPRTALLTSSPKEGFHNIQLSQGSNYRFAGRIHRICERELVRGRSRGVAGLRGLTA